MAGKGAWVWILLVGLSLVAVPSAGQTADLVAWPHEAHPEEPVKLDASNSTSQAGGIVLWEFDVDGDGTFNITDENDGVIQHSYATTGTFEPVVRVTDQEERQDTAATEVVITANEAPSASLDVSPQPAEVDETVTFDGSGASDPDGDVVLWEVDVDGDGTFNITDETDGVLEHTYSQTGTYDAVLRVTDDDGATATVSREVTIEEATNEAPTADLAFSPDHPDPNETVTLDGSGSTDPDGSVVFWRIDYEDDGTYDDSAETSGVFEHNYSSTGTYTARLEVSDADGATDTATVEVPVEANQAPNADLAVTPSPAEPGETVTLDGSGSTDADGSVIYWRIDYEGDGTYDDSSEMGGVFEHNYSQTGTYAPTLLAVDEDGAEATTSADLNVEEQVQAPTARLSISPPDPAPGDQVTLDGSASTTPEGSIVLWEVDVEGDGVYDASSETSGVFEHAYPEAGSYTPVLRVSDDRGESDATTGYVEVGEGQAFNVSISVDPAQPRVGEDTRLSLESRGGVPTQVTWTIDGETVAEAEQLDHAFAEAGIYEIEAAALAEDGRRASDTLRLEVVVQPSQPDTEHVAEKPGPHTRTLDLEICGAGGNLSVGLQDLGWPDRRGLSLSQASFTTNPAAAGGPVDNDTGTSASTDATSPPNAAVGGKCRMSFKTHVGLAPETPAPCLTEGGSSALYEVGHEGLPNQAIDEATMSVDVSDEALESMGVADPSDLVARRFRGLPTSDVFLGEDVRFVNANLTFPNEEDPPDLSEVSWTVAFYPAQRASADDNETGNETTGAPGECGLVTVGGGPDPVEDARPEPRIWTALFLPDHEGKRSIDEDIYTPATGGLVDGAGGIPTVDVEDLVQREPASPPSNHLSASDGVTVAETPISLPRSGNVTAVHPVILEPEHRFVFRTETLVEGHVLPTGSVLSPQNDWTPKEQRRIERSESLPANALWKPVETEHTDSRTRSDGQQIHEIEIRSPGASLFALGPPTAAIQVTNASLDRAEVEAGSPLTVHATVENRGQAPGAAEIPVHVDGEETAWRKVELDPGQTRDVELEITLEDPGARQVTVQGMIAGQALVSSTGEAGGAIPGPSWIAVLAVALGAAAFPRRYR